MTNSEIRLCAAFSLIKHNTDKKNSLLHTHLYQPKLTHLMFDERERVKFYFVWILCECVNYEV